jgi:hypothetical protein
LYGAFHRRDLWIKAFADGNYDAFSFCTSSTRHLACAERVRSEPGLTSRVDNVASLRFSPPNVSVRSLTGRENTRRQFAVTRQLASRRTEGELDFYCFFPTTGAPISRLELLLCACGGLYKYACRRNAGRLDTSASQSTDALAESADWEANATNVRNVVCRADYSGRRVRRRGILFVTRCPVFAALEF